MKTEIFGVNYTPTDYEEASDIIIDKACLHSSFGVSALAVHGLIECYHSPSLREKINKIDLIVPDGQPVRWVINNFYQLQLKDRVYGPVLTLHVLRKANDLSLKVFLYGSKKETIEKFSAFITTNFPKVKITGIHPDRFREANQQEDEEDIAKIKTSGAHIVLVGRGCPRQEVWVSDHLGKVNAPMMAVGAAFDFYAGTLKQAPVWMQNNGLEWLFRLIMEPGRLWKRYLFTNSTFIYLFILKKAGIKI